MMENKVAVITYHKTRNYGAILQCYSLQKTISKILKCESQVLNYSCDYLEKVYKLKKIYEIRGIKELIKWFLMINNEKRLQKGFDTFIADNINLSSKYDSKNIKSSNKDFNIFITGSDQVWNGKLNGNDSNYFLDFVDDNNFCFSYAASFGGGSIGDFEKQMIRKNLPKYSGISVREQDAIGLINNNLDFDKDIKLVLDPTLLLDYSDWVNLIKDDRKYKRNKYILVYIIADTPTILEFAKKLAKQKNMDVICIHKSYKNYSGVKNIKDASVYDFLNYIYYADYVVTSSFHGMCFALNFHKNFFYELDNRKINNNSRIESLIQISNLSSREIINGCNSSLEENIDYDRVEADLKKYREESYEFIKKIKELR